MTATAAFEAWPSMLDLRGEETLGASHRKIQQALRKHRILGRFISLQVLDKSTICATKIKLPTVEKISWCKTSDVRTGKEREGAKIQFLRQVGNYAVSFPSNKMNKEFAFFGFDSIVYLFWFFWAILRGWRGSWRRFFRPRSADGLKLPPTAWQRASEPLPYRMG